MPLLGESLSTPQARVEDWLERFSAALQSRDVEGVVEQFEPEGLWRDMVSMTFNIATMEGRDAIERMLRATLSSVEPSDWAVESAEAKSLEGLGSWDEGWLTFQTREFTAKAVVRVREGRAWTLLTSAQELRSFPSPVGLNRPLGAQHGPTRGRVTWQERKDKLERELGYDEQPFVVLVGGGQGALGLAARLKVAGVPTLIVDRLDGPGDAWRRRYRCLTLHDTSTYNTLPHVPFPDFWPTFTPKDQIADFLACYAKLLSLNYWSRSNVDAVRWNPEAEEWVVEVTRRESRDDPSKGEKVVLRPKHVVVATGMSGAPNVPRFEGEELFAGQTCHSSAFGDGRPYEGKDCVVVGANNSAHDVAQDLWEAGARSVTMLQRSSTHVIKSKTFVDLFLGPLYSDKAKAEGTSVEKADLILASIPMRHFADFQRPLVEETKRRDAEFYKQLDAVGFVNDFGEDGTGLFLKYLRRGSGYVIDVGASDLVLRGEIKVEHSSIARFTERSVILANGKELPADLVVKATGFANMNSALSDVVGPELAAQVGMIWGFGSSTTRDPGPWEGEIRNMWKPTNVQNLWIHGGNLYQSRAYGKYLALQLKARYEGIPTPVYGIGKVHHKC